VFGWFARRAIKSSTSISATNESEMTYIRRLVGDKKAVLHIPNGVMLDQFNKLSNLAYQPDEPMVVSYIGNVGIAQNLTVLLRAALVLPDIQFNIVGAGTDLERIKAFVTDNRMGNVTLTGRLPWDEVLTIYQQSTVLYAQLSRNFMTAMPSKLYEYLATGRFVVYGGGEQAASLLSQFENNHVVPADDVSALIQVLKEAKEKRHYQRVSSTNPEIIRERFIREHSALQLIQELV
jgi:glycosyltransferase involved in cell wall biosynthesis